MKYDVVKKTEDTALVTLYPVTDAEKKLLKENNDPDTIVLYYHKAIEEKLPSYALLEVIDKRYWPNNALVSVQKIIGLGH